MSKRFGITHARTWEEKQPALELVKKRYLPIYGTTPPISDVYTVAWEDGQVAGCIGMDFAQGGELLSIERQYHLLRGELSLPLDSQNGMQFGRWVSGNPLASPHIIYHAACYCLDHEKRYGLVEHDHIVHRAAKLLGVRFWDIRNATLDLNEIPENNRAYYAHCSMKPYLVDLGQITDALKTRIG